MKWFRLAAEQGLAEAQSSLGLSYNLGRGVPQDFKEAVKWFRLVAEQGLADAQKNLGWMYANGQGVIRNDVHAHMWFNISASQGQEEAKENRDLITKQMSQSQIEEARKLARECVKKNYKGC